MQIPRCLLSWGAVCSFCTSILLGCVRSAPLNSSVNTTGLEDPKDSTPQSLQPRLPKASSRRYKKCHRHLGISWSPRTGVSLSLLLFLDSLSPAPHPLSHSSSLLLPPKSKVENILYGLRRVTSNFLWSVGPDITGMSSALLKTCQAKPVFFRRKNPPLSSSHYKKMEWPRKTAFRGSSSQITGQLNGTITSRSLVIRRQDLWYGLQVAPVFEMSLWSLSNKIG